MSYVLVLITFSLILLPDSKANDKNLQLKFGDTLSIYAEKAFRSATNKSFEAVGNVVIIANSETLYGEKASLDMEKGKVNIEGNVRVVTKDMTLYGSKINYDSSSGNLSLRNARIISPDFNIIASSIQKTGEKQYEAKQAEFTTCTDCKESWSVFGDSIKIEVGNYVYITHALIKVKGVSIVYLPYIILPIKNTRESGLLFPSFFSRVDEGISYAQPYFWAINNSADMTFSPSFWGERGYGLDYQFRQVFSQNSWVELDARGISDLMYEPGDHSRDLTGKDYFRGFGQLETHQQISHDVSAHIRSGAIKDLDFIGDFPDYFENHLNEESVGFEGYIESRSDLFNIALEAEHKKSFFDVDTEKYDPSYVQIMPSVQLSLSPLSLIQNDDDYFNSISFSFNSDLTVFKQDEEYEPIYLRNFRRATLEPSIHFSLYNDSRYQLSTELTHYYNDYVFDKKNEEYFNKNATSFQTKFSFSLDRIFGLAFKETIRASELEDDSHLQEAVSSDDLLGAIPRFDDSLTKESITIEKNSYRHSQEFNLVHHFITSNEESGNKGFLDQIKTTEGVNDYDDLLIEDQGEVGSNISRTRIPRLNTFEFQWNNVLIKKTPKSENYFQDRKYIRDNFNYTKIGHFNLSQGYLLDKKVETKDKFTRLYLDTQYSTSTWNFNYTEFYFHNDSSHISSLSFQKRFDSISFLTSYNLNSANDNPLNTIKLGTQYRPIDSLGLSYVQEQDLEADENITTIFQADIMPDNNCWILNLNYRVSNDLHVFAFNFVFNYGNDSFDDFKTNFFSYARLN